MYIHIYIYIYTYICLYHHHHHHHREGAVYTSFCLGSSSFAATEIASRRWWCIESLFPDGHRAVKGALPSLRDKDQGAVTLLTRTSSAMKHYD